MRFIVRILITTLAVLATSYLFPSSWVRLDSFQVALIVAVVLAFLNAVVRPLLIILTIPATILTLGLFLLVINAAMILITDHYVKGFEIVAPNAFWKALVFSLVLSVVNGVFEGMRKTEDNRNNQDNNPDDGGGQNFQQFQ